MIFYDLNKVMLFYLLVTQSIFPLSPKYYYVQFVIEDFLFLFKI